MNNKRKNRPAPNNNRYSHDRPQRGGRPVSAQGIYNNSFFMHAATSYVGSLVQIETHAGSIFEGVFRAFSPQFDVAIELAQCIKNNQVNQSDDCKSSLPRCMIFQASNIVSIVAKDVDLDFVTSGAFQTDSAISRCNGSRADFKKLEPWDEPLCPINGDLELDSNANGWDANDMFNKNEKLYGVQSTFDQSLAGYTVQIEKKDTQDYKDAEAEAEKIAQEIENNPDYHERVDLENGDEEARYAAVERPADRTSSSFEPKSPDSISPQNSNSNNFSGPPSVADRSTTSASSSSSSSASSAAAAAAAAAKSAATKVGGGSQIASGGGMQKSGNNSNSVSSSGIGGGGSTGGAGNTSGGSSSSGGSVDKYVPPPKRKNILAPKLVRGTPPPNSNNGHLAQQNSHNNNKNNNYQSMQQMQQGPPQFMLNQNYTHIHGHPGNLSQSKINGDGNSNNNNNKPLPQRNMRQYSTQSSTSSNYSDTQSSISSQMSMGKPPPMHVSQNHGHVPSQHVSGGIQEPPPQQQQQPPSHVVVPAHHVVVSGATLVAQPPPQQNQPPPQPQRQPRTRDEIQDLRKFQQDFILAGQNQQPPPPQQQQGQQSMGQIKTPSVSPHQQQQQQPPQPSLSPPQQLQQPQMPPPQVQHPQHHQQQPPPMQHQQPQQHSQQQQTDHPSPPMGQQQKCPPHVQQHLGQDPSQQQQQQPPQQSYVASQPPPPVQQQQPPPTIVQSVVPSSTTPPQQQQQGQSHIVNTNSNNSATDGVSSDKVGGATGVGVGGVVKKTPHVLNPAAKPFTPRSPSTPNPSRPHTPQTPGPAMTPGVYTQGPHVAQQPQMVTTYVMQPHQQTYQTPPHPHGGTQIRRRLAVPSQIQVSAATATGQPLLTAAPIPQFMQYPQGPHPQHFQQSYQNMTVRMFTEPPPQQFHILAQTPPSTTPSPGQPHQQFHPGPQPSPAGGGPPSFGQGGPQSHYPTVMCPVIGHPQIMPQFFQGAGQTPHHAQQFQVIMQQQHPAQ